MKKYEIEISVKIVIEANDFLEARKKAKEKIIDYCEEILTSSPKIIESWQLN